jgi:tight adherence protein B
MLGPTGLFFAIVLLAAFSAGGLAYAFLRDRIREEGQMELRLTQLSNKASALTQARQTDAGKRRKTIQETLKEIEQKQKARAKQSKSPPLVLRLQQAGLEWSHRKFLLISVGCGAGAILIALLFGLPLYAVFAAGVAGALGLPRWVVSHFRKRRFRQFTSEFPNAVDVIVRGIRAGLPVGDCLRIIAAEAREPVRSEFRKIVDQQQGLGLPLTDAVARLPERVPLPEANFFAIVIAIQQKAGGNLGEALGNLSRILRERAKMKGKIQAMSMEAKASAWIIGALPPLVMTITYFTNPKYITLLFTDPLGNVILGGAALWMAIGIVVMRRMIDFKY